MLEAVVQTVLYQYRKRKIRQGDLPICPSRFSPQSTHCTARHGSHQPITLAATEPLHTFYTYRHIPTLKSRTRVRFISVPRVMKATSPLLSSYSSSTRTDDPMQSLKVYLSSRPSPSTFTFTPIPSPSHIYQCV